MVLEEGIWTTRAGEAERLVSQRFSGYEPHPPNARGVPGRGPSRSRISVFCQTKRRGILATAEARTQCQGGYRVGVLRAKSDFRFLPDKNDAGFSHLPRDPALAPVAAALAPSVAAAAR